MQDRPPITAEARPTGRPAHKSVRLVISILLPSACAALMFVRLGHYPLWDDEATTAMFGRNVLKTGDVSAVVGHNVIAYRGGKELVNLKMRYLPPLQYYAVAAGAWFLGETDFAARFPFALAGFVTVVVIVRWLWQSRAGALTWAGMSIALVCNVSLLLFVRQCRYYALSLLFSVLVVYLYAHAGKRRSSMLWLSAACVALLASNYISFLALMLVLAVDYMGWRRHERPLRATDWAWLIGPMALVGLPIVLIFNPLGKGIVEGDTVPWLHQHAVLLWRNLRELNRCEFGVGILLVLAPILRVWVRDAWLGRVSLGIAVYLLAVSILSPQPIGTTTMADVRYLVPLIPALAFLAVRVLCVLTKGTRWPALPLMLVCFGSNLLHGTWIKSIGFLHQQGVHCSLLQFCGELRTPQRSPFGEAADWVNANVPAGANVWVVPAHYLYPLMLYAPEPTYGYQLQQPVDPQFAELPDVHTIGKVAPDFVICFGSKGRREWETNRPSLASGLGAHYARAATLDVFGRDLTRPELYWHDFKTVTEFDRDIQGVSVFKRIQAPALTGTSGAFRAVRPNGEQ